MEKEKGKENGEGKGKVEGRKLKKSWTHGHAGDFILCPMLCIALDRQQEENLPTVHNLEGAIFPHLHVATDAATGSRRTVWFWTKRQSYLCAKSYNAEAKKSRYA